MLAQKVYSRASSEYLIHSVDLPEFDMTDKEQVLGLVEDVLPDVIVNCAAYTNVDGCETERDLAMQVNGTAVGFLAEAAKKSGAILVQVSTDYVFDGKKNVAYIEEDSTGPQSVYGESKLLGEKQVLSSGLEKFFIVRTSWLYGPGGNNFVETILRLAAAREELRIIHDQVGSPTYTGDLAQAIIELLEAAQPSSYGLYHFSNEGQCSWYEFTKEIVSLAKESGLELKTKKVVPIKTEEYPLPAARPAFSVFSKDKYKLLTAKNVPEWRESLREYFAERKNS